MSTRELPNLQTLVSNRKLQKEAEQVFKKIHEGEERFDDCWERIHETTNPTQREKFENELKKEIKKLQRLREQVKSWASNNEFKDKRILLEYRREIESQYMEKYKTLERKSKRGRSGNITSKKKKKKKKELPKAAQKKRNLLQGRIAQIEEIKERVDYTIDRLNENRRPDQDEIQKNEETLEKVNFFVGGLELCVRLLEESRVQPTDLEEIDDDVTFFIEEYDSPDFVFADDIFDKFKDLENGPIVELEKRVEGKKVSKQTKKKNEGEKKVRKKAVGPTNELKLTFNRPRVPSTEKKVKKKKPKPSQETVLRFNPRPVEKPAPSQKKKKRRAGGDRNPELVFNLGRSTKKKSKNEKKERKKTQKKEKVTNPNTRGKGGSSSKQQPQRSKDTHKSSTRSKRNENHEESIDNEENDAGSRRNDNYSYEEYNDYPSSSRERNDSTNDSQGYEVYKYRDDRGYRNNEEYYHYETYEKWGGSGNHSSRDKRMTNSGSHRRHQENNEYPAQHYEPKRGRGRSNAGSDSGGISSNIVDDYHYKSKERSRRSSTSSSSSDQSNSSSPQSSTSKTASISYKEAVKRPLPKDKEDEKLLDPRYGGGKMGHSALSSGRMVMLEGGLGSQDMVIEPGQVRREGQLPPPGSHLMEHNPEVPPQDLTPVFTNESTLFRLGDGRRPPANLHELQQRNRHGKNFPPNHQHLNVPPSNHLSGGPMVNPTTMGGGGHVGGGRIEEELKNLGLPISLLDMTPPAQVTHEEQQLLSILRRSYQTKPSVLDSDISYQIYTPMRLEKNIPSCFPQKYNPLFNNPSTYSKFDTETLFFAFYYQRGTYNQYLAAKELKKQSWRFHKKYLTWFQRYETPRETTNKYELGNYVYFDYDYNGWCQRIKKGFRFKYDFLENELQ